MTTEDIHNEDYDQDPNIASDGTLIGIETKNIEYILNNHAHSHPRMVLKAKQELKDVKSLLKRVNQGEYFGWQRPTYNDLFTELEKLSPHELKKPLIIKNYPEGKQTLHNHFEFRHEEIEQKKKNEDDLLEETNLIEVLVLYVSLDESETVYDMIGD